jgi:hypothetical protein
MATAPSQAAVDAAYEQLSAGCKLCVSADGPRAAPSLAAPATRRVGG